MATKNTLKKAYDISKNNEVYAGNVEITDLKSDLGTPGSILVVRGDLAYQDKIENGNPKFWIYENMINSNRVQRELRENPNHRLFDGVGFSSLEAMNYHAGKIGRGATFVMARELYDKIDLKSISRRYPDAEIIRTDGPAEEGYVAKQKEILDSRGDLIPMHQALNGVGALAPIGNRISSDLIKRGISPDETYWVMASGSNMYGIGSKIRDEFGSTINLVEPEENFTVPKDLDVYDKKEVREYARDRLKNYTLEDWDGNYSEINPLHIKHPNRYLLLNWLYTGEMGIDSVSRHSKEDAKQTQDLLRGINPEYNWTPTTALAMTSAIEAAKEGKNVLVMAYGKGKIW
tara:strand:+ start:1995 stop:3032 length:1038 start_codon:yes stop_codon:yes gene_type:complete